MAINRPNDDRRRTRLRAEARRRTPAGDFLASRGMGVSPGEESRTGGVAAQTIEAQPVFGQIRPSRGEVRPRAEHLQGEGVADIGRAMQEVGSFHRRERSNVRQRAGSAAEKIRTRSRPVHSVRQKRAACWYSAPMDTASYKAQVDGLRHAKISKGPRAEHKGYAYRAAPVTAD
jgi:hypothetical protein